MWPPSGSEGGIADQLPRCLRFYPHDSGGAGGGFFACVVEKVRDLPLNARGRQRRKGVTGPSTFPGERAFRRLCPTTDAAFLAYLRRTPLAKEQDRFLTRTPAGLPAKAVCLAPVDAHRLDGLRLVAAGDVLFVRTNTSGYRATPAGRLERNAAKFGAATRGPFTRSLSQITCVSHDKRIHPSRDLEER